MDKEFKWEPWERKDKTDKNLRTDIAEPPCMYCRLWEPRDVFLHNGIYAGVNCCNAQEMQQDFSCFKNKE